MLMSQPRSQALPSRGGKTLAGAGHVSRGIRVVKKWRHQGGAPKQKMSLTRQWVGEVILSRTIMDCELQTREKKNIFQHVVISCTAVLNASKCQM